MNLIWETSPERRDATVAALHDGGAEVRERLGFEPISTIAAVAAVLAIGRAIADLYRDHRYHGVIIDLTKDPVELRDMAAWDRGQVLVIGADGPHFHSFTSEDQLTALISAAGGS